MTNERNRILIVEDEVIIAQDLQVRLSSLGYEALDFCTSGEEAIRHAETKRPDLVLMDIRLEGEMDGIKTAEIVQNRLRIPVVFLSAHAEETTIHRATETAPMGYLSKPVQERDLRMVVELALHRSRADQKLAESQRWLSNILSSVADGVVVTTIHSEISHFNRVAERITGTPSDAALGSALDDVFRLRDANGQPLLAQGLAAWIESQPNREWTGNAFVQSDDRGLVPIDCEISALRNDKDGVEGAVCVFRDISVRRRMEEERDGLIRELQQALEQVKALQGLIPICLYCKNIRDDSGFWQQVEAYVEQHSSARFSHGICPDCLKRHYPEIADDALENLDLRPSGSDASPKPKSDSPAG